MVVSVMFAWEVEEERQVADQAGGTLSKIGRAHV